MLCYVATVNTTTLVRHRVLAKLSGVCDIPLISGNFVGETRVIWIRTEFVLGLRKSIIYLTLVLGN